MRPARLPSPVLTSQDQSQQVNFHQQEQDDHTDLFAHFGDTDESDYDECQETSLTLLNNVSRRQKDLLIWRPTRRER